MKHMAYCTQPAGGIRPVAASLYRDVSLSMFFLTVNGLSIVQVKDRRKGEEARTSIEVCVVPIAPSAGHSSSCQTPDQVPGHFVI